MYRATKEDYVMYIKLNRTSPNGKDTLAEINKINGAVANKVMVIYTPKLESDEKIFIKITIGRKENEINQNINQILSSGFYDCIKDRKFYEYLGEYQENTSASTENKKINRVITYDECSI